MDSSLAAPVTTAVLFFLLRNRTASFAPFAAASFAASFGSIVSFHVRCFHGVPSLSLADGLWHDEHGFIAPYANLYLHAGRGFDFHVPVQQVPISFSCSRYVKVKAGV